MNKLSKLFITTKTVSLVFLLQLVFSFLFISPRQVYAALATGGTITTDGEYTIHKFTSNGTFNTQGNTLGNVTYFILGGGGGGASSAPSNGGGSGGGAGGYRYFSTPSALSASSYSVVVGTGGPSWSSGNLSSFNGYTAAGGGAGGYFQNVGVSGGSGGGGGYVGKNGGAGNTPSTSPAQGYGGGKGDGGNPYMGGGGGGAGEVGEADGNHQGGDGLSNSITGSSVTYGGGGGAGKHSSTPGVGGTGGGGTGGNSGQVGAAGTSGLGGGGGGGGAWTSSRSGGTGGSGVVIIRYLEISAPTIGSATTLSTSSIRWGFTDNSAVETGFKVYDNGTPTLKSTCATANLTYCDETGLAVNTSYTRKVIAYNGSGSSSYSSTASKYTLANAPSTPTVTPVSDTTETVVINVNSNPSSTEFLIQETSSGKYVNKSTGALQVGESWGTYAEFGSGSGTTITGLVEDTSYTFKVKARNGDSVSTSYSSTASATTPVTAPTIGSASALTSTSIRWNFTDNSSAETGFRVFDVGNTLKVQCATINLLYCDETSLSINTQYTRKIAAYNGSGNSSYSSTDIKYTLTTIPGTTIVNNAATTTLDVNPDPNSNPASTQMVIYKETGATCDGSGGSYLAVNGSDNGSTPVWQTESSWATVTATGLSEMTQYSFCVKSRNGDNVETSWSTAVSGSTIESTPPSISSITSVAGDTTSSYYDNTDDSSTAIVLVSTDGSGGGVSACKWNTTDVAYDLMSNSCASTSSCTTNLSGEGAKTVYIRCTDIYSNKMSSSQTVSYTIDATAPSTLSATGSSASWTNAKPTVTVSTPTDAVSGMNEIRYVWDTNNLGADCSAGTTTSATTDLTSTLTQGSHILYLCASDNAGNVSTWNGAYKWDNGNPLVNITTHTLTAYRAANIPAKIQGTASDVLSSISSVAVSIYNGVNYWSGSLFDSVSQVWLATTGTDTWEYDFAPTSDGDYTIQSRSTDVANNTTNSLFTNFAYDGTIPSLDVAESASVTSSGGTVTWTTDEISSTQVEYGTNSSYGTTTTEVDTSPRVTPHSVILSGLQACVTYHYRVISRDAAGNARFGSDQTLTTLGCTGSSTVETLAESTVATSSGGTVTLQESGADKVALIVPANFSASDADFQVKRLAKSTVILATSTPTTAKQAIGDHIYQIDAVTSLSEKITSFDELISITMTYTTAQITGYDESGLLIYRWDGSDWYALDSCVVDTVAKTVSCTTTAFSTFILFGEETVTIAAASSGSSSSSNGDEACISQPPGINPSRIYATKSTSTSIKLYFTDSDEPVGNYVLKYGLEPDKYIYGQQNIGRYGQRIYTVNDLKPNTDYYFRIMAVNRCRQVGPWSNEIMGSTKSHNTPSLEEELTILELPKQEVDQAKPKTVVEKTIDMIDQAKSKADKNIFEKIIATITNSWTRLLGKVFD